MNFISYVRNKRFQLNQYFFSSKVYMLESYILSAVKPNPYITAAPLLYSNNKMIFNETQYSLETLIVPFQIIRYNYSHISDAASNFFPSIQ